MTYIFPLSSMKLTGWQKETGLGLEKTILQDRAHGSICPSSPLHGLITPVIDIKKNQVKYWYRNKLKMSVPCSNSIVLYQMILILYNMLHVLLSIFQFLNQNKWLFTVMRFYHCMAKKINVLFLKLCGIRLNVTLINFALLERGNTLILR